VPPDALSVTGIPVQVSTLGPALIASAVLTVTVTVAKFEQPLLLVPVTVYVVVTVGLAITLVPVVADKPVPGAHV
jgi:hypothetical protein